MSANKGIVKLSYYDSNGSFIISEESPAVDSAETDDTVSQRESASVTPLAQSILKTIIDEGSYMSGIYYEIDLSPRMNLMIPVKDNDGQVAGIIMSKVDMQPVKDILEHLSFEQWTFAYIVSSEGSLVLHPFVTNTSDYDWSSIPPVKAFIDKTWDHGDSKLQSYHNANNINVIGALSQIPGTKWGIILEERAGVFFRQISPHLGISFSISMVFLLLCILFSYKYIRKLISPFEELFEGADAIAKGDLQHRINLNTGDELQELSESFNGMAQSLEDKSRDRDQALAELTKSKQELEESNQQLKDASRLKSEFLANMSHELRTPMNAVIGYTSIMMDGIYGELTSKQETSLKKIYKNARNLSRLIDDILDLSKIEAGSMPVFRERFFISHLIKEIIEVYAPAMKEKEIDYNLSFKDDIELESDRSKVKQVLDHIISNAVKFTEEGSIIIVAEKTQKNDFLQISISDTGIGIKEEHLERIFDEFRQLDGSFTRLYGGTGLGLAIVKKILKLLDARITVESKEGEGSIFRVYLPLIEKPESITPRVSMVMPPSYVESDELEPLSLDSEMKKIMLVIDDDPDVINIMQDILKGTDYRVVGVMSAQEGLELARKLRPHVITLDIFMKDSNGWDVLYELKKDPVTLDIPIFVISISDEIAKGYSMGITEFFVKPINRGLLLRRLTVLNRLRGKKILIIDDDKGFLENFYRIIREQGFQIIHCDNGIEGLEKIRVEKPDVVILDLMMPKFSGFDVLKTLANESINPALPIIVLTAKELTLKEKELLSSQVVSVLTKSGVTREEMLPKLRSVLERIFCEGVVFTDIKSKD